MFDITIKKKKKKKKEKENMHTDGCGNNCRQNCHSKGSRKENNTRGCIEIKRMWNMKCMITRVIIGATGIVTKYLKKNLEPYQENIQ